MGQQHNKVIKRRRRKAYLERKKARIKAGITIGKPSKGTKTDGAKKAVKKAPAKKAAKPAAKKAEAAPETEAPAEGTTENA